MYVHLPRKAVLGLTRFSGGAVDRFADMARWPVFLAKAVFYCLRDIVFRLKYAKTVALQVSDIVIGVGATVVGGGMVFVISIMSLFLGAADVAVVFDTLGTALAGQGDEIRGLIDHTAVLAGVAHEHRKNAKAFVEDLARLARIRGVGEDIGTVADSGAATGGFTRHKGGMTQGVRSAERAVALLSRQLGIGGPAIRTLDEMLPIYRALGFAPIGEDKRMLAVNIVLPSDPCQMFLGVCPEEGR